MTSKSAKLKTMLRTSSWFGGIGLLAVIATILFYAVVISERGISFSIGDKKITIFEGGKQKIVGLEKTIQDTKTDFDGLARAFKKFREEESIEISRFPRELQGNPQEVLSKIWQVYDEMRGRAQDVGFSFYAVQSTLYRNGTINTRLPPYDEGRTELYRHIQRCLSAVGSYSGKIDGEQASTCFGVERFQAGNNLKVDGIIGRETWATLTEKFEQERLQ